MKTPLFSLIIAIVGISLGAFAADELRVAVAGPPAIAAEPGTDPAYDDLTIATRDPKVFNAIDRFVLARLRAENVEPSPVCTDLEFVRRVYIDVVGVTPTANEVRAFLNDRSETRRGKLIDKLLADNERYADHWEVMWGDWLREHSVAKRKEGTTAASYREWLRNALKTNMPYDKFARALITASGKPDANGAVNFYLRDQKNRVETVNTVAQTFMGSRMACAQCHDHPFDKWTQTDFHGLAAYFSQVNVSNAKIAKKVYGESNVEDKPTGEYHMPADGDSAKKGAKGGEVVKPVFPWDPSAVVSSNRRQSLADTVVNSPRFPQVQINRLWSQLMGRGIVEPADDFRAKNPPSHPELLEFLAQQFVESKFDTKHILRLILNSAAYQRSTQPNDSNRSDAMLFSHQRVRRLSGEELFDSILVAAGHTKGLAEVPNAKAANNISGQKGGAKGGGNKTNVEWAADLPTPAKTGTFMNLFNQPSRDVIMPRREESGAVTQALEMLNGKAVNEAIRTSPLLEKLAATKTDMRTAVTEVYLNTLTRFPTSQETEQAMKHATSNEREWLEDLQWSLMNAREFTFLR